MADGASGLRTLALRSQGQNIVEGLGQGRPVAKVRGRSEKSAVSESPPHQGCPDRKAGSHRRQQHKASLLQLTFLDSRIHRQRNRAGSRISKAVNVDDDASLS